MPRARTTFVPVLALAAGLAGALLTATRAPADPPAVPPPQKLPRASGPGAPADAYVGAEECARCHRENHTAWAGSTHALTFTEANRETVPPEVWDGQEVEHGPGKTRFRNSDGVLLAHTPGPDGKEQSFRLTHQVGRTRIHMFVATLYDGRMQVLPSMREHGTGAWFDYTSLFFAGPGGDPNVPPEVKPGDPSFWTGPVRSWDAQCSRCHLSGREALAPPVIGAGPRSKGRVLGLDCESCHGPGAAHAEHHDKDLPGLDPIVKQRLLPHRLKVDVCLVCHMETEEIVPGWRPGRGDLVDWVDPSLLDDPDRVDPAGRPLELVYAGVSFWSSRCADQGGLTCLTCHDPHGSELRSAMRADVMPAPRDNAQCARCHRQVAADVAGHTHHDPKGEGGRCVNCHMPMLTVERGHGAVTDHTISIPRPNLKSDRVAQDACAGCHVGGRAAPPGAPALSEVEIRRRHADWWPKAQTLPPWLDAIAKGRAGAWDAVSRLNALLDDPDAPRFARGTAPTLLARLGDAARASLVERAHDKDSLVRRRVADALPNVPTAEAWAALVHLLDDPSYAVQAHAARAALNAPGYLVADKPALQRVLQVLEQETQWVIDDDLRWQRLAEARALAGDAAGAAAARERQARLDPDNERVAGHAPASSDDRVAVLEQAILRIVDYKPDVRQVLLLEPFWKPSDEKFDEKTRQFIEEKSGKAISDELWDNFTKGAGQELAAPPTIDLGVPTHGLPRPEFEALFKAGPDEGWAAFHARFPGAPGAISASPVVLDAARTRAMLWILFDGGSLEARGTVMILEKRLGRWRIASDVTLYIS